MNTFEQLRRQFDSHYYTYVPHVIPDEERVILLRYALDRAKTKTMTPDSRVPGTPAAYGDPRMEDLLEKLVPVVEQVTGLCLFPTYSYFRVYKNGDSLSKHMDRPACEISVSLSLGCQPDTSWPLWVEGPRGKRSIELQRGDAVVYRGTHCPHWRESFSGEVAAQVFLHYVDQHGPQAAWKFDKRTRLGSLPKRPIGISKDIQTFSEAQGLLILDSGKKIKFGALGVLLWKDLEAQCPISAMVQHVTDALKMTEMEAELLVLKFISGCEDKGLLISCASTLK